MAGIAALVSEARLVVPVHLVRLCRDPEDDMVLECCRAARAQPLITGDRDLLDLGPGFGHVPGVTRLPIVTPRAYLDAVPRTRPRRR